MELSKNDTKILKGIAILLMVLLHLFARKDVNGLYEIFPVVNDVPLVYYIGLMGDACRPIYLFVTGYAFFIMINQSNGSVFAKNIRRILKLLVNLWVVILIFVPIGLLIGNEQVFTYDVQKFILNSFALSNSYNGAWWFVQIYIIFVLVSPILIRMVNRFHPMFLFFVSGILYFITYVQRFKNIIDFGNNPIVLEIVSLLVLLGTSQFSFFVGALFAKEKIYTKISAYLRDVKYKNFFGAMLILFLIGFHSIIESAIIAPINGILFVCIYLLMNKHKTVQKTLEFVSSHSTNIWLTHMFFYSTIFSDMVFAPKYPILVFLWLITLCILTSYVIKAAVNPIHRWIDKKSTAIQIDQGLVRSSWNKK